MRGGWRPYKKSFLSRVQQIRIDYWQTQARAALAAAEQATDGARLVAAAERDARKLARESAEWASALAQLIGAGAAALRKDRRAAIDRLAKANEELLGVDMKLFAASARVRRGELMRDAAMVDAALSEMQRLGVRNPSKMVRALAPGFGLLLAAQGG
jgi:hypothetical protein